MTPYHIEREALCVTANSAAQLPTSVKGGSIPTSASCPFSPQQRTHFSPQQRTHFSPQQRTHYGHDATSVQGQKATCWLLQFYVDLLLDNDRAAL